jgi:hypothetical protein
MESHPVPPVVESGRGTLAGEALFLLRMSALAVVLGLEWVYYLSRGFLFAFLGSAYRARMRRLVLGTGGATAAVASLALLVILGGAGCASPAPRDPVSPWSFKAQMREMRWSIETIADMSDAKQSLEDDLEAFGPDAHWREDLRFSAEALFLMPDAKESLESDLKAFGDPDHKQHGLKETFELWGF